jgi:hypothetical protein
MGNAHACTVSVLKKIKQSVLRQPVDVTERIKKSVGRIWI